MNTKFLVIKNFPYKDLTGVFASDYYFGRCLLVPMMVRDFYPRDIATTSQTLNQALAVIASPISTASSYSLEALMSAADKAAPLVRFASTVFGRVSNGFL